MEGFANEKADAGDVAGALKALATLAQLLDAPEASSLPGASAASRDKALEGWRAQRDATIRMLKTLAAEVAASGDPEARAVVIEVSAVVKQLTAEPATGLQVGELMTWLQNDDVVAEVDEFAEPVREPLMARLRDLQAAFAA